MATTPEQLCEFIMAHARGERVEEREHDADVWEPHLGSWPPSWQYRIAPKPKRKIVLRQVLLRHNDGSYWVPDRLVQNQEEIAAKWSTSDFVQWVGEPIEIEVEDV